MADLNKDGLDDETGLPMDPHVNPTAIPLPKPNLLSEEEAAQELYDKDPALKIDKPASEQSSHLAAGRKHLKDQKEIEDAAKEAGIETVEPAEPKSLLGKIKDGLSKEGARFEKPETANVSGTGSETSSDTSSTSSTETSTPSDTTTSDTSDAGASGDRNTTKPGSYKLRSIMDAYNDGEIDKSTRDYLIVDTLSKFARGLGKDISNIGAAYTGGTIQDSTPEETLWGARNAEMAKQGISSEANKVAGSDREQNYRAKETNIKANELSNELTGYKLEIPRTYEQLIQNADSISAPWLRAAVKGSAQAMLNNAVNGGELNPTTLITNIIANGGTELAQAAKDAGKSPEQYVADTVKSMLPEVKATVF